jgi:hypothetical protein
MPRVVSGIVQIVASCEPCTGKEQQSESQSQDAGQQPIADASRSKRRLCMDHEPFHPPWRSRNDYLQR